MANNPTDSGPKLPTRNVYVINSAADLPQVLSQYVIYNLQYDPGDGVGLYYSPDGTSLVRIGAGGGGASSLEDLTDVNITSLQPGQYLRYDGFFWVNYTLVVTAIDVSFDPAGTGLSATNVQDAIDEMAVLEGYPKQLAWAGIR